MRAAVCRAAMCLALAVTPAMVVGACGNNGTPSGTDPKTTTSAERVTTTTDQPVHRLTVSVMAGKVVGGARRERIEVGEIVDITVNSDAGDELHVHGYDRTAEVKAGAPTGLRFTADIPGVFEVELEESGLKLLEIEVR